MSARDPPVTLAHVGGLAPALAGVARRTRVEAAGTTTKSATMAAARNRLEHEVIDGTMRRGIGRIYERTRSFASHLGPPRRQHRGTTSGPPQTKPWSRVTVGGLPEDGEKARAPDPVDDLVVEDSGVGPR